MPMEEPPKGAQPRMGRNLLPGKADSDCFLPVMSSNEIGHCLGTRYVGVLRAFFHVYTQAHPKQRPLATAWIGLQRGDPTAQCADETVSTVSLLALSAANRYPSFVSLHSCSRVWLHAVLGHPGAPASPDQARCDGGIRVPAL